MQEASSAVAQVVEPSGNAASTMLCDTDCLLKEVEQLCYTEISPQQQPGASTNTAIDGVATA